MKKDFRKYQEKLEEIIKGDDRDFPVFGHFLANFFGFFHLRSQDIGEDLRSRIVPFFGRQITTKCQDTYSSFTRLS